MAVKSAGERKASSPAEKRGRGKPKTKVKGTRLRRGEASVRIPEILAAAVAEFAEKGFLGARMEDIAARVGVSKPIIYRHFKSKQALLEAFFAQELTQDFVEMGQQIAAYDGPLKPMLRAIIARAKQDTPGAEGRFAAFRLTLADGYRVPTFSRNFHRKGLAPVRDGVKAAFSRAMARGTMRKDDPEFAIWLPLHGF